MNILINFLNGNDYWRQKIRASALEAASRMTSPDFLAWVRSQDHFDDTNDTPEQVAAKIEAAGDVRINVGFYSSFFTRAIAYEEDGAVYFNTWKEKYGAGSPGNLAHEAMHAPPFNYEHNGNSPAGNQQTVPWAVGNKVDA